MKKSIFLLLLFYFLLFTQILPAQNLVERLGGTNTDIQITNDGNDISVIAQAITQRGRASFDDGFESAYGYGYQVFALEFTTKTKIKDKLVPVTLTSADEKYKRESKMTFYAADGSVLIEEKKTELKKLFWKTRVGGMPDNEFYYYTLNLENYPLILLDKVARIDFSGIKESRKKLNKKKDKT